MNRSSSRSIAHRRESTQAGLGLSLALVKALVQALGGTIGVERSTLGRASFFIELPEAEKTDSTLEPKRRIVIIGGVAAGTKVASKIARLDHQTEVTLVERGDAPVVRGMPPALLHRRGRPRKTGTDVHASKRCAIRSSSRT